MQIDPKPRRYSKLINGVMHHYDDVWHEPIINYEPVDPRKPELGVRQVNDILEIPIDPDIEGNTKYWKPEMVINPQGCKHDLQITNVSKREIECNNCHWAFTFHINDYFEKDDSAFVTIKKKSYPVSL